MRINNLALDDTASATLQRVHCFSQWQQLATLRFVSLLHSAIGEKFAGNTSSTAGLFRDPGNVPWNSARLRPQSCTIKSGAAGSRTTIRRELKPVAVRVGAWLAPITSTFRAFAIFAQFLSPRVFLSLVTGRWRVEQGKEKLHRGPDGVMTSTACLPRNTAGSRERAQPKRILPN